VPAGRAARAAPPCALLATRHTCFRAPRAPPPARPRPAAPGLCPGAAPRAAGPRTACSCGAGPSMPFSAREAERQRAEHQDAWRQGASRRRGAGRGVAQTRGQGSDGCGRTPGGVWATPALALRGSHTARSGTPRTAPALGSRLSAGSRGSASRAHCPLRGATRSVQKEKGRLQGSRLGLSRLPLGCGLDKTKAGDAGPHQQKVRRRGGPRAKRSLPARIGAQP